MLPHLSRNLVFLGEVHGVPSLIFMHLLDVPILDRVHVVRHSPNGSIAQQANRISNSYWLLAGEEMLVDVACAQFHGFLSRAHRFQPFLLDLQPWHFKLSFPPHVPKPFHRQLMELRIVAGQPDAAGTLRATRGRDHDFVLNNRRVCSDCRGLALAVVYRDALNGWRRKR